MTSLHTWRSVRTTRATAEPHRIRTWLFVRANSQLRASQPVAVCEIFVIFTPQTALTPRHLHTFYIQHSDYVMRTWPVGGPHKNRHRHHLPSTGLKPPGKSFYIICLNYNQVIARPDTVNVRASSNIIIFSSDSPSPSQTKPDPAWHRCRPTCRLIYSICQAGREGCIMNETSGPQWVENSDNIYFRFVLEIGT